MAVLGPSMQLWGHRVFLPFCEPVCRAIPAFHASSPLRLEEKMQVKIKGFKTHLGVNACMKKDAFNSFRR